MRIFIAGATGAIGRLLVSMLVSAGHDVTGTTRSPDKASTLRTAGADAMVVDGLDRDAVIEAVRVARPGVIVHQLSALSGPANFRRFDDTFALTNRLRLEGTNHLLAAAQAAGVPRFIAQSFTGWPNARSGGAIKTEDDQLESEPPAASRQTLRAIEHVEQVTTTARDIHGLVLRYGSFYGPGTALGAGGEIVEMIRKRRLPVVGGGTAVWSLIHIDDAAAATLAAIERGGPGIYNIVDDDPAPVAEVLPALAAAVGARPPMKVPAWLVRPVLGEFGVTFMTTLRGSSNAKAKRELGWRPRYSSWREGFRTALG